MAFKLIKKLKKTGSEISSNVGAADVEKLAQKRNQLIAGLFIVSIILVVFGLFVVYSAVSYDSSYSYAKQIGGVVFGLLLMFIIWRFDYKYLADLVVPLLIINIFLIMLPHVPFLGVTVNGAKSWIRLGAQIQPGEFAKVTVILLSASVVSKYGGKLDRPIEYLKSLVILLIPFVCIMTQPDLGTGLVYLFITAIALIAGGAKIKYLLLTLFTFGAMVALVFALDEVFKTVNESGEVEYHFVKNYQRQRLFVFMDPDNDTSSSGYNLRQAQIAIGSGGLFGKGFLNGTQAALKFLPEAPTDFIFCVLAEEFGFVGFLVLISLYSTLIIISLKIARAAYDLFGKLIVYCVVGMWVFQIFENIGMDCGLMPITGIPLPFISYGSSFMVVNMVMLGMIGSVAVNGIVVRRRKKGRNGSSRRHK